MKLYFFYFKEESLSYEWGSFVENKFKDKYNIEILKFIKQKMNIRKVNLKYKCKLIFRKIEKKLEERI